MKLLLLLPFLVGLLQAKVVHRHLDILEGDVTYRQIITLDYDKNIQIVEVPAHNNIVHSKTIFDFNKGKLFESHPEDKICYVRDIPEGTTDLKTFDEYLQKKNKVKLMASKEKKIEKAFKNSRKLNVKMLKSMTSETIEECGQSQIYEVTEVSMETRKTLVDVKKVSSYEKIMRFPKEINCEIPNECLWQTCHYGKDSCYWTVNCRPQAGSNTDHCDVYHSHNLHNGDNQISCKACWNLQCGQDCVDVWNIPECHDMIAGTGRIGACPEDPDYGGDCVDVSEPHCYLPNVYFPDVPGKFDCPTGDLEKGIVHMGGMCFYVCPDNQFGGYLTCKTDGKNEGKFDETSYMPQNCK